MFKKLILSFSLLLAGVVAFGQPTANKTNNLIAYGWIIGLIAWVAAMVVIVFAIRRRRARGSGGHIIGSRGGASPFWWMVAEAPSDLKGKPGNYWAKFSGGGGTSGGGGASGSW